MKSKQHRHNSYIFKTAKTALCAFKSSFPSILTPETQPGRLLFSNRVLAAAFAELLINAPIHFRIRKVNPATFDHFGNDSCL